MVGKRSGIMDILMSRHPTWIRWRLRVCVWIIFTLNRVVLRPVEVCWPAVIQTAMGYSGPDIPYVLKRPPSLICSKMRVMRLHILGNGMWGRLRNHPRPTLELWVLIIGYPMIISSRWIRSSLWMVARPENSMAKVRKLSSMKRSSISRRKRTPNNLFSWSFGTALLTNHTAGLKPIWHFIAICQRSIQRIRWV